MSNQNIPNKLRVGMDNGHNASIIYNAGIGEGSVCMVYGIFDHARVDECQECEGMPVAKKIVWGYNNIDEAIGLLKGVLRGDTTPSDICSFLDEIEEDI